MDELVTGDVSASEETVAPTEASTPSEDPFQAAFERALERSGTPADDDAPSGDPDGSKVPPVTDEPPSASVPGSDPKPEEQAPDPAHEAAVQARERERQKAAMRAEIAAEELEEHSFRELYTGLLAEQAEDPEAFAKRLREDAKGPDLLRFMQAYEKAHPDVTLDAPETPVVRRAEVYRQAATDAFSTVDSALEALATKHGLPDGVLETAYAKSGGDFQVYLDTVIAEAVKAGVERERPKIAKAERDAHAAELQAVRAKQTIVTPRFISGSAAAAAERRVDHSSDRASALETAAALAAARQSA